MNECVFTCVCVCFYCACRAKTISVYIVNVSKFQSQTAISIEKSILLINRLIFSGIVFVVRFKHFRFQIGELRWRTSLNVCVSVFVSQCPTIASAIHKINALLCTLFGFFFGRCLCWHFTVYTLHFCVCKQILKFQLDSPFLCFLLYYETKFQHFLISTSDKKNSAKHL